MKDLLVMMGYVPCKVCKYSDDKLGMCTFHSFKGRLCQLYRGYEEDIKKTDLFIEEKIMGRGW